MNKIIYIILFASFFCAQKTALAQKPETKLSKQIVELGDTLNFSVKIPFTKGDSVVFQHFNDTIAHDIEILSQKIDTTGNYLTKTFIIIAFDDTLHKIPPVYVDVNGNRYFTDSLYFRVIPPQLDSAYLAENIDTNFKAKILPNVAPIDAPWTFKEFWQTYGKAIIIGLVAIAIIAAIIVLIIIYIRKKQNRPVLKREKPKEPPHIIALRKLEELRKEKLWQNGKYKLYYSKLTDIIREYLEYRYSISTFEKTSAEIIFMLENGKLVENEKINLLRQIFSTADLAKFAKAKPLPDENDLALKNAISFVEKTQQTTQDEKNTENETLTNSTEKTQTNV